MFFLMVLAMAGTIYNIAVIEGGEWPTISVQGDLDPTNIYTLQGWAYDEFKATARDAVSDWEALQNGGNDDDDDDSNSTDDQIKQTQVNRDWNLLAIFRVRGELGAPGRNLLTPDRIGFMKGVQDRLMNVGADDGYPAFEDVCLKKPVNYTPSFLFAAPEMDNETVLECALPSSPLNHFYASQTEDHAYVAVFFLFLSQRFCQTRCFAPFLSPSITFGAVHCFVVSCHVVQVQHVRGSLF